MCSVVYGGIVSSAADMKLMIGASRISHASFHQASYFFYCVWSVGGWGHVEGGDVGGWEHVEGGDVGDWGRGRLGTRETGDVRDWGRDVMGWGCEGLGV